MRASLHDMQPRYPAQELCRCRLLFSAAAGPEALRADAGEPPSWSRLGAGQQHAQSVRPEEEVRHPDHHQLGAAEGAGEAEQNERAVAFAAPVAATDRGHPQHVAVSSGAAWRLGRDRGAGRCLPGSPTRFSFVRLCVPGGRFVTSGYPIRLGEGPLPRPWRRSAAGRDSTFNRMPSRRRDQERRMLRVTADERPRRLAVSRRRFSATGRLTRSARQ